MAKKTKGGSHFGEFDVDDMDFDFEDPMLSPEKNDRSPVTRFKKDFFQGLKDTAKSPSFYKKILRKALPEQYGVIFDAADGAIDAGGDLYNTSVSKLAPTVKALKKKTRSILPSSEKVIPKALQSKLKSWAEDDYDGTTAKLSAEQVQQANIALEMGDMFATQITESAKQYDGTMRRDVLRSVMEGKRHNQSISALDTLRLGINSLVSYQDNITIKYQRKSLELQYRHLYATKDLIDTFNDKSVKNLDALQGILKNTGLPDALKLRNTEAFGNIARERFINKVHGQAFGGIDKIIERVAGNAKRMLGEKIDSVNSAVEQAMSIGEMTAGLDRANMAGNVGGYLVADQISNRAAGPLGEFLSKRPKLTSLLARTSSTIRNANGHLDAFSNSPTDVDENTWRGRAKGGFLNTMKELVKGPGTAGITAGDMTEGANDASSFTVLTRRSITDVIPGLLSRILREVTVLSTGDPKTSLITYDLNRWRFNDTRETKQNILNRVLAKDSIVVKKKVAGNLLKAGTAEVKSTTGSYVDDMIKKIDPNSKLSAEARSALGRQLLHNSMQGKGFIPKKMARAQSYASSIKSKHKVELSNFFRNEFRANQDRALGDGVDIDIKENEISNNFNLLAQNVPAIIDEIELALKVPEGREHLESLGFLKYDGKVSKLNYDAIIDFILNNSNANTTTSGGGPSPLPNSGGNSNLTGGNQHATTSGTSSATGGGGGNTTYRFSRNGTNFRPGSAIRSNLNASKEHSPISRFRNLLGNAFSQGPAFKNKAIKRLTAITDTARNHVNNPNALLGDAKQNLRNASDSVRYQAWQAKNAVAENMPDVTNEADRIVGNIRQQLPNQYSAAKKRVSDLGLSNKTEEFFDKLEAFSKTALESSKTFGKTVASQVKEKGKAAATEVESRFQTYTNKAKTTPEEVVEGGLIQTYTEAATAKGGRPSLAGLKNWMDSTRASIQSFKFGAKGEMGGDGERGNIGGNNTTNDFQDNVIKLLTRNTESLDNIKDLLQAGIVMHTNAQGGDGRRFGFRYGLRSGLGKLMSGAGSLVGSSMKFYGKGLSAVGSVLKGAGAIAGGLMSRLGLGVLRRYSDIYVRGNPHPVIFAKGIKEGRYTDVITQKKIKGLKDIKGPVVDDLGNQVLTLEDFEKGLYDTQKKPILNRILNGVIGFYGKLLSPFTLAASMAVGVMKFVGKQLTKQKDIYVKGEPLPRMRASIMATGGYLSQRTHKPIQSIKDLDGPVVDRDGNIILNNDDIKRGLVDVNGRNIQTLGEKLWNVGSRIAGFGFGVAKAIIKTSWKIGVGGLKLAKNIGIKGYNFLMRGFGLSQVEAVTLGNSNQTVQLLTEIRDILDGRLPEKKRKLFSDTDGDGIRENSVADKLRKKKVAMEAAARKGAGSAAGGSMWGGLGDKLKGLFGKKDEDEEEGAGDTNIIGGFGGGKNAPSGPPKPLGRMGRAWEKVKGVGRKIPGGRFLGRGLGMLGRGAGWAGRIGLGVLGLETLGLGGVGAGLLSAGGTVLAGAGGLLAGIGAILASPIVLGALAVTAVAVGGYYAYKYLSGANNTEFQTIRLAQYGINPVKEDQASKVLGLENAVEKFVTLNGATADLKMPAEDIAKALQAFGVNAEDDNAVESWVTWFNERFKQVYVMHRAACEKTVPGSTLKQMDAKWNKAQKSEALKLVRQDYSYSPYSVQSSPFTVPMSGDRQVIAKAFEDAEKAFKETTPAADKTTFAPIVGTMGMMAGSAMMPIGKKPETTSTPVTVTQLTGKAAVANKFNISGTVTATASFSGANSRSSSFSAMDCVRYKAYGLVNLDIDKVRVLQDLEKSIFPEIKFSTKGEASFEGEAEEYLDRFSSMFGVSASNTRLVSDWTVWFSTRFIPVFVAFCTAVREQNKTVDILDASQYLKPDQMLNIAQTLVAVKTGGFFSSSIWSIPHSPWADYVLNNDSSSTKGNIDSLKNTVKHRELADQTAVTNAMSAGMNLSSEKDKEWQGSIFPTGKDADKPQSLFSTIANIAIGNKTPPPSLVQQAVENKNSKDFGNATYMMPVEGRISSSYGMREHPIDGEEKQHKGVDIAAPNGTPILAAADGVIMIRSWLQGYGNAIYIRHPDGKSTRYAHMSSFQEGLSVGSPVKRGAIIGYVGSTGGSTGNHLHFEVREGTANDAAAIDPVKFLGDRKAEAEIAELKGYEKAATSGAATTGDATGPSGATGATGEASTPSVAMTPAPTPAPRSITNSLRVLEPAAATPTYLAGSVPSATASSDEAAEEAERLVAVRKKAEQQQARTIESRNRSENERVAVDMSAVVEVLNRSYDVQVQMRDGISDLGEAMRSMSKSEPDAKPTGATNPGRRPTAVPMKENPVSMKKSGY